MSNSNVSVVVPDTIGGKYAADFVRDTLASIRKATRNVAVIADTFGLTSDWSHGDCATLARTLIVTAYSDTDPDSLRGAPTAARREDVRWTDWYNLKNALDNRRRALGKVEDDGEDNGEDAGQDAGEDVGEDAGQVEEPTTDWLALVRQAAHNAAAAGLSADDILAAAAAGVDA